MKRKLTIQLVPFGRTPGGGPSGGLIVAINLDCGLDANFDC